MEDIRDMRDPQDIGEIILEERQEGFKGSASEIYDSVIAGGAVIVKEMTKSKSMVDETTAAYLAELRSRARNNDRFAMTLLKWYHEHGTFQGAPSEPEE